MKTEWSFADENWAVIANLLPDNWRKMAKELGAYQRMRKFRDMDSLLRTMLVYLAEDCSQRQTVVLARESDIADISDVAFL